MGHRGVVRYARRLTGFHSSEIYSTTIKNVIQHMFPLCRCSRRVINTTLGGTRNIYAVTGADTGLGLATTAALVQTGATVVMGCSDVSRGHQLADKINSSIVNLCSLRGMTQGARNRVLLKSGVGAPGTPDEGRRTPVREEVDDVGAS